MQTSGPDHSQTNPEAALKHFLYHGLNKHLFLIKNLVSGIRAKKQKHAAYTNTPKSIKLKAGPLKNKTKQKKNSDLEAGKMAQAIKYLPM